MDDYMRDWAYPENRDYWFEELLRWVEDNKSYVGWIDELSRYQI